MNERKPELRLLTNVPVEVEMIFDKPLTGDAPSKFNAGEYFKWTIFCVKNLADGEEYVLKGGETKWVKELSRYKRGDRVRILKKEEYSDKMRKTIRFVEISPLGKNDQPTTKLPNRQEEVKADSGFDVLDF